MPNAKDYNPADYGLMVDVIGPPGSGKSHFARSAVAAYPGQSFALLTPASEIASYAGLDLDYEVIVEPEWEPTAGKYVATGFPQLKAHLKTLEEKKPRVIVVDTLSSLADVIAHSVLAPHRVDNPQEMSNPFAFYGAFRNRVTEFMDRLNYLRYKLKAHVIVAWHEDVREVEGLGTKRKDAKGEVHWDVAKTPMLAGSLRNDIGKWFDAHFYAEAVVGSKPFRCKLHALPTGTQLAKTRLQIVEKLQALAEIPNDFPTICKMVEEVYHAKK